MIPTGKHGSVDGDFERAWTRAEPIPGWLTKAQARVLYDEACALASGACVVEIGSHQGRSTIILASAVQSTNGVVHAIDPFVEGRLFGGKRTGELFERNVATAGVASSVELRAEYSTRLRPSWQQPIDLLYIDGKHDYWTFTDDARWAVHVADNGAVLVHDAFSSIGVTLGILARILPSGNLRYERREGSLAVFRTGRPVLEDRLRIVREIPWWLRNVFIKVLLRLRLRHVAAWFGHQGPYDPY